MSRHLLAILLSEIQTFRLICQRDGCGGVVEVSLKQLAAVHRPVCPGCQKPFAVGDDDQFPHVRLAEALQRLDAHTGAVKIEFVIPEKP